MTEPRASRPPAREEYLRARGLGLSSEVAGNLAAIEAGLAPSARSPWTWQEIERLLFLRTIVTRIEPMHRGPARMSGPSDD